MEIDNGSIFFAPVGVGTNTPAGKLEVAGTSPDNPNVFATGYGVNGSFLGRRASGTQTAPTAVTSGANIAVFGARGYGATGFSASSRASIAMRAAETWTDSAQGTSIGILTTSIGSTSPTEKISISDVGAVGIGQSTPTAVLHLKAGTTAASSAPLKLTAGTNMTTPENGAFEFDGTNLYFTVGGVRKTVTLV